MNCDRCGQEITELPPHKLCYGHLKEPPTEEVCFLCTYCYIVWDKMFLRVFRKNEVVKNAKTAKIALGLIMKLLKNTEQEKVQFT